MPVSTLICQNPKCGKEFENITYHNKSEAKRFCDSCLNKKQVEYSRAYRLKKKREALR